MAAKTVAVSCALDDKFAITTDIRGHQLVIDQPKTAGGADQGPTPLEYFLYAIGGCIGSIARIIAMQEKIALRGMALHIEGDMDSAGLLGKATDARVGFQHIRIQAEIDADLTDAQKQDFLERTCLRCPLHDNISHETEVVHQLQ